MTDVRRSPLDDHALARALRDLATAVDWPAATSTDGPDLATRVRVRLQDGGAVGATGARRTGWRPARRAIVFALLALLALAAVAGAVGLGLPGLRISLGPVPGSPSPPPPPSSAPSATAPPGPPGAGLGLGTVVPLAGLDAAAGRHIALPADPLLGPPDAVWIDKTRASQVALVWRPRPGLPATSDPGIGLVLMSFDGSIEPGFYEKMVDSGTVMTPIHVGADAGFWFDGDPHVFLYRTAADASPGIVDDPRRWVDRALVWSDGTTTSRIETGLPMEDAIRIAASLR